MARFEAIVLILFIVLQIKVAVGLKIGIFDRQLYRVVPRNELQLSGLLENVMRNQEVVLWSGMGESGGPLELLATAKAMEKFSQESLIPLGLKSEVVFTDVDIIMSTKSPEECKCERNPSFPAPDPERPYNEFGFDHKYDTSNNLTSDEVPIERIPGTSLFTGVYYKMSMKRFPNGSLTWTDATNQHCANYVQIDLNPENRLHYKEGGKWYNDTQWMFRPTEYPNWYTWDNRALFNSENKAITTWSYDKVGNGHHIIASRKPSDVTQLSAGGNWRVHALWKPVAVEGEEVYYKIVNKNFPQETITWTEKKYGNNSHYIQVDISPENIPFYQRGGKWFEDSLFSFELVDSDQVRTEMLQTSLLLDQE